MDEKLRCLELIVLHVSPGEVADGGIGLPVPGIDIGAQAALKVACARGPLHRIALEGNHSINVIPHGEVIIKGRKLGHPGAKSRLAVAAVKIN